MKVACLQFAPEVGKLQENIARADSILLEAQLPFDVDWLVLPELAFTGMLFGSCLRSLHVIIVDYMVD
jgi:protein N-terminal amidase